MIKLNSAARVLTGLACVAMAGMSAAGCSATANATPVGSGSGPATTAATSSNTASSSTAPGSTAPAATGSSAQNAASGTGNQGSAASPVAAPSSSRCHTPELSASYTVVADSAAAGSISYNLRLTNKSMHQCTIYGFAGMLLLDANHKPLPTKVQWDSLVPKRLLRLNPGGSAAATVRFSPDVPGVGDNASAAPGQQWTCEPTAYYTEVTPPDETTQLVTAVSPATPVCERGTMAVSAFVAGSTGPNQ